MLQGNCVDLILTARWLGIRRICALLHSGEVSKSWLEFWFAKALTIWNDDRMADDHIRVGSRILETAGRWTMPARRFNEVDIDFDAIDGELAKLVPPKLSLTDVLDRLRKRLVEQQSKGVTVAQMHEVLNAGGIAITERSLRTFLTKGVLPGRKVAEAARAMVSEEGKDPF